MSVSVRTIQSKDRSEWNKLWHGYLRFYETELSEQQTELTFTRLTDSNYPIYGLVAELDGKLVGLVHYSYSHSTWAESQDVYLEDLFVDPECRNQGIGKLLILEVSQIAEAAGNRKVYWETHRDNLTAQALYDKLAKQSEFITYVREISQLGS